MVQQGTCYLLFTLHRRVLIWQIGNDQLLFSDMSFKKFNYCLLFAKYYLYCQKLNKKQINFDEFKQRIGFKLHIEGFHSSISLIFIIHLVHISHACYNLCLCVCVPCCITVCAWYKIMQTNLYICQHSQRYL